MSQRIVYIFLFFVVIVSCKKVTNYTENKEKISKEERLDLFLETPLLLNSDLDVIKISSTKFKKSYSTLENVHFTRQLDTIIRYSSKNKDVIELYKSNMVEHIIYLKLHSNGIQLSNGVFIGMSIKEFSNLFPLELNQQNIAIYQNVDDYFEVKFFFDKEKETLSEIEYIAITD